MRYRTNQEVLSCATIHFIQDEAGVTPVLEPFRKDRPIMLLKFWGIDYPYLNNGNCLQGCLPVPENSEAKRHIIRLTGYPSVKYSGLLHNI